MQIADNWVIPELEDECAPRTASAAIRQAVRLIEDVERKERAAARAAAFGGTLQEARREAAAIRAQAGALGREAYGLSRASGEPRWFETLAEKVASILENNPLFGVLAAHRVDDALGFEREQLQYFLDQVENCNQRIAGLEAEKTQAEWKSTFATDSRRQRRLARQLEKIELALRQAQQARSYAGENIPQIQYRLAELEQVEAEVERCQAMSEEARAQRNREIQQTAADMARRWDEVVRALDDLQAAEDLPHCARLAVEAVFGAASRASILAGVPADWPGELTLDTPTYVVACRRGQMALEDVMTVRELGKRLGEIARLGQSDSRASRSKDKIRVIQATRPVRSGPCVILDLKELGRALKAPPRGRPDYIQVGPALVGGRALRDLARILNDGVKVLEADGDHLTWVFEDPSRKLVVKTTLKGMRPSGETYPYARVPFPPAISQPGGLK